MILFYEKVRIYNKDITQSADDDAGITVWVNDEQAIFLPLVHEGKLTIRLTAAGLSALEESIGEDLAKVEFQENDLNN
jgi:hypothetical protein